VDDAKPIPPWIGGSRIAQTREETLRNLGAAEKLSYILRNLQAELRLISCRIFAQRPAQGRAEGALGDALGQL